MGSALNYEKIYVEVENEFKDKIAAVKNKGGSFIEKRDNIIRKASVL